MTRLNHKCKFCSIDLVLDCDEEYAKMRDPHNLLPLVCCTRCADLRVRRRAIFERVQAMCACFGEQSERQSLHELRAAARPLIRKTMVAWYELSQEWHRVTNGSWDEFCVDSIVDSPSHFESILGKVWHLAHKQA